MSVAKSRGSLPQGGWRFQEFGPSATTNAGTYQKLLDKQSSAANLIAREVIQNSEDASLRNAGQADIPFRMEFEFAKIDGDAASGVYAQLGIDELLDRVREVDQQGAGDADGRGVVKALGLHEEVKVRTLMRKPEVRLLSMSDFGARGLVGDVELLDGSAWFNCLLALGQTADKAQGSGGSYGFGKTAFVQGSGLRTVFVYTKTGPSGERGSRAFGAMAYWRGYKLNGKTLTGLAALGDPSQPFDWFNKPFVDADADELAAMLGFPVRSDAPEDRGTTIGVLAPVVSPDDLEEAIELNWWPAFEGLQPRLSAAIVDWEGNRRSVAPRQSDALRTVRRAYELATSEQSPASGYEYKKVIRDASGRKLGTFAAVADPETCYLTSLPGSAGGRARFSSVALMRKPRMVVRYQDFAKGAGNSPFVDGVFVSNDQDPAVEDTLRDCEPAAHDFWWPVRAADAPAFKREHPDRASVALAVKDGIKECVDEFRASIKPTINEERSIIKNFGGLLGRLLKTPGPQPPPSKPEPFSIQFPIQPHLVDSDDGLRYRTVGEFSIQGRAAKPGYPIQIGWSYKIVADEDGKGDDVGFDFKVLEYPKGFDVAALRGWLQKDEVVKIEFTSEVVPDDLSIVALPSMAQAKLAGGRS